MYNYSIMPLDTDHLEAVCEDIRQQYRQGVTDCALFKMTLVPEGNPPIPKAEMMCEQFDQFREILSKDNIPCGMLMQASIGHGYTLDALFPFQQYIRLSDGGEEFIACPYDEGFQEYIRHTMEVMASHHPDVIMVDDDFRLINARAGKGCACPLHMAEFNRRSDVPKTREQLWNHVIGDEIEDMKYRDLHIQNQVDSLLASARAMREGIDRVDPTLPGIFCCVGNACEGAVEIATILAGKGNPVIVRVNNGNYTPAGARYFSRSMMRAAKQIAVMNAQGHVDAYLAETDTCPQNRYSTGAQSLHSHFTGTILEGASGAKHWITRLATHEPNSGKAYRKLLAKNTGFYQALSELVPSLRWTGCLIPITAVPDYGFKGNSYFSTWGLNILERLGLPMYFSPNRDNAVFLDNDVDKEFSDEELLELFKGTVFVDGPAAESLTNRGFSKYLGVTATPWTGERLSGEALYINGNICSAQYIGRKLTPIDDTVVTESMTYHLVGGKERKPLFPGVTVYKNELGGTAVTFCGQTDTPFSYGTAFSFLNESRKLQLIDLMKHYGDLPVYYPGDAEVYLRAAYMPDNSLFCGFFNIGLDPIEEIELVCDREISQVEMLMPDGSRKTCEFEQLGDTLTVREPAYTLNPVILFLK